MISLALLASGCAAMAGPVQGSDDPGARALRQHQLQWQQQQEAVELRLQQQQRAVQSPPADLRWRQRAQQLDLDQQQRQQELHYRQGVEPPAGQPSDDEGTHRAKAQMDLQRARQQGEQQLHRFETQAQQQGEQSRKVEVRGEIIPSQPQ